MNAPAETRNQNKEPELGGIQNQQYNPHPPVPEYG